MDQTVTQSSNLSDILAVASFIVACLTLYLTTKNQKAMQENQIIKMLIEAEDKIQASIENQYKGYEIAIQRYVNTLEMMCYSYQNGDINSKFFNSCFKNLIIKLFTQEIFKDYLPKDNKNMLVVTYNEFGGNYRIDKNK